MRFHILLLGALALTACQTAPAPTPSLPTGPAASWRRPVGGLSAAAGTSVRNHRVHAAAGATPPAWGGGLLSVSAAPGSVRTHGACLIHGW